MSYPTKTIDNNQSLGLPGAALSVDSNITFNGKVYCTNVGNCFNLQYGDVTSLQSLVPNINTAYSNTAIGMNTLPVLVSGYANTGVGSYALHGSTSGVQNTALGSAALYANTTGQYNVAVGNDCLLQNTNGSNNTGVGKGCMFGGGGVSIWSFNNCVGVGHQALANLTTANYNVGVGTQAGGSLTSGSRNTLIGCTANTSADSCVQSTALGYGAMATLSNQIMLGTATETVYIPNAMVTQGLVYESVNATGGVVNAYTINYASGGLFAIGTTPTAASTLAVTNIPTDTTKSYTFSVSYQQPSTRFYIATVQIQNTAGAYITNSGTAGFVAPLWNGGAPSLSGTTNCVIIQSFTVISVGGSRRVISTLSCCS
jgi:hypothetical protein